MKYAPMASLEGTLPPDRRIRAILRGMKYLRNILVISLLALFLAAPAFAQNQSLMTERELSKFIADWPAVLQWLDARGRDLDSAPTRQALAAYFAGADFETFIRGKGWTVERFGYVAGTTFTLVMYVNFERENPDVVKQFDQAIAEVRSNAEMTPEQKKETIEGLEEAKKSIMNFVDDAELNEAELKLVRAKYDSLIKIIEGPED